MTPEDIKKIQEEVEAEIRATVKDRFKEALTYTIGSDVRELVRSHVREFLKTEVAPALDRELLAHKEGILGAVIKATAVMGDELTAALVADFKKRAGDTWQRQKIVEALLGK